MARVTAAFVLLAGATLACAGCRREVPERRAAPGDAGSATITSAPISDAGGEAEPNGDRERSGKLVSADAFGLVAEDAPGGGARVVQVTPGSQAGALLRPGEVITSVDNAPVHTASDLARFQRDVGRGIVLLHVRSTDGATRYVAFTWQ